MRPVTDRQRISREKLAYLVDSTAAPVACVALISTWIGYQVSLIGDALTRDRLGSEPVRGLPALDSRTPSTRCSPWSSPSRWRCRGATGARCWPPSGAPPAASCWPSTAQPLADYESTGLTPDEGTPRRWWNAAVPVLTVVAVTLGRPLRVRARWRSPSAAAAAIAARGHRRVGPVHGAAVGEPRRAHRGGGAGRGPGILGLREALEATVGGFKSMLIAVVVLVLAWSLGQVCDELDTADFLVAVVGPAVPPGAAARGGVPGGGGGVLRHRHLVGHDGDPDPTRGPGRPPRPGGRHPP